MAGRGLWVYSFVVPSSTLSVPLTVPQTGPGHTGHWLP
jgi:hypothetical protein